ncbi:MAG: glycosyltransferase, partial [Candidatus Kapaibacterium sp.]
MTNEYTEDQAEQTPSESPTNEHRGQRDRHRYRRRHPRHGNGPREWQSAGTDDDRSYDERTGEGREEASHGRDERSGERYGEHSADRSGDRSNERRNDRNRRNNRRGSGGRGRDGRGGGKPSISVVIPLLNEEESLDELTNRLLPVLETESGGRYEILYIDDGPTDSSFEIIRKWNRRNARVRGIRFRRN